MDTQKKNPYKRSVPLVQMTPIYHFQADEVGATLRATEVKPKLDRYLIRAAFGGKPELYKPYLIAAQSNDEADKDGEKRLALNYRLSISVEPSSPVEVVDLHVEQKDKNGKTITDKFGKPKKVFIGSIWDSKTPPKGTMLREKTKISLNFFSRYPELLDAIEQWIDAFFAGENFGRRQSKGFGSFITEKTSGCYSLYEKALHQHMCTLRFPMKSSAMKVAYIEFPTKTFRRFYQGQEQLLSGKSDTDATEVLDVIRDIHHVMKSGFIRQSDEEKRRVYIPSFLLKNYAKKEATEALDNEKKTMKTQILLKIQGLRLPDKKLSAESSAEGRRFFRAMLGLPPFYEFRFLGHPQRDKPSDPDGKNQSLEARININDAENTSDKVARFRSPITYKPVEIAGVWRCYLIPVPIPQEMFGRNFSFALNRPEEPKYKDVASLRNIEWPASHQTQTPTAQEFDLIEFLEEFTSEERPFRENATYDGTRFVTKCSFGHLEIKKEERPDE